MVADFAWKTKKEKKLNDTCIQSSSPFSMVGGTKISDFFIRPELSVFLIQRPDRILLIAIALKKLFAKCLEHSVLLVQKRITFLKSQICLAKSFLEIFSSFSRKFFMIFLLNLEIFRIDSIIHMFFFSFQKKTARNWSTV